MTVQEMHNQVRMGLQSIDASRFDDFLSEEIDIVLNNAQIRWVKQVYDNISPEKPDGFEVNEKRIAQLSSLVTYTPPLTPKALAQFSTTTNVKYVDQPENLLYQVGTLFQYRYIKGDGVLQKVLVGPKAQHVVKLDLQNFIDQVSNFDNVQLNVVTATSTTQIIRNKVPSNVSVQDKASFIGWLMARTSNANTYLHLSDLNLEIYYERYREEYISEGLIFVCPDTVLSIEITNGVITESGAASAVFNSADYTISSNATTEGLGTGKFYTHDDIEDALTHSFKKPSLKYGRFLYTIKNRKAVLYDNGDFNVSKVILKFIRKPNIISLSLKQDCELPSYTHDEIVQMAVYELMQKTSNPGTQLQAEFLTRTE